MSIYKTIHGPLTQVYQSIHRLTLYTFKHVTLLRRLEGIIATHSVLSTTPVSKVSLVQKGSDHFIDDYFY